MSTNDNALTQGTYKIFKELNPTEVRLDGELLPLASLQHRFEA